MTLAEGEVRQLTFFAPDELTPQKFIVDSFELHLNGPLETDPEEQREYEGYSLIRECNDYSPEGVLVWFPEFKAYGSADTEHQRIIIYPGVTWSDILRERRRYRHGCSGHREHKGYEVEFTSLDGETIAVVTLFPDQLRAAHAGEIAHARKLAAKQVAGATESQ